MLLVMLVIFFGMFIGVVATLVGIKLAEMKQTKEDFELLLLSIEFKNGQLPFWDNYVGFSTSIEKSLYGYLLFLRGAHKIYQEHRMFESFEAYINKNYPPVVDV